MQKEIERNFDKVAKNRSYDDSASIQKDSAKLLVEIFEGFVESSNSLKIQKILDIGAGTGFVAERLLQKYSNAFYHLNDISEEMLKISSSQFKQKNFSLIHGDIEKIHLKDLYDLIISNFAFQWLENLEMLLKDIFVNKRTKYIIFTTLVDNNFQEIKKLFQKYEIETLNYLSSNQLENFIKSQDIKRFFSQKKTYNLEFESFSEYAKYIKNIGANFIKNNSQNLKHILRNEKSSILLNYEVYFCCIQVF